MDASRIDLPPNVVHIRSTTFTALTPRLDELTTHLSAEELDRAKQFYFARHRDAFILGRGFLRAVLARYVDIEPRRLAFEYAPYGKPGLTPAQAEVCFNVSHSGDLLVCAVSRNRDLGIDCEVLRDNIDIEGLSRRYFSATEIETLLDLPPHERVRAFFTCWTRKEAYIKAQGDGLSMPLDTFAVSLAPGEPAALLSCDRPQELDRWELHNLPVPAPYAAALVVSGKGATLAYPDVE